MSTFPFAGKQRIFTLVFVLRLCEYFSCGPSQGLSLADMLVSTNFQLDSKG